MLLDGLVGGRRRADAHIKTDTREVTAEENCRFVFKIGEPIWIQKHQRLRGESLMRLVSGKCREGHVKLRQVRTGKDVVISDAR